MPIEPDAALWCQAPPPQPSVRACVVLPVRNEQARLAQSLQALTTQRTPEGAVLPPACYEILVLVNNSDDDSLAIATRFAEASAVGGGMPAIHVAWVELPPDLAHIGHVRRLLMDAACERLERLDRGGIDEFGDNLGDDPVRIIASTDSDTRVAPDWLAQTLVEIDRGVDAVGGRIEIDASEPVPGRVLRWQRCDSAWRLAVSKLQSRIDPDPADPWPRHHQHFCASLAVRQRAYRQVGGIPPVRWLEDEALVAALRRAGLSLRHSPAVRVRTSGRPEGRVDVGLSWQLREWERESSAAPTLQVVSAAQVLADLRTVRALRRLWQASAAELPVVLDERLESAAMRLHVDPLRLRQTLVSARADAASFDRFRSDAEALRPAADAPQQVPVRAAIDKLRSMIRAFDAGGDIDRDDGGDEEGNDGEDGNDGDDRQRRSNTSMR